MGYFSGNRNHVIAIMILGFTVICLTILYVRIAAHCNPCETAAEFPLNAAKMPTAEYLDQFPDPIPEFLVYAYRSPSGGFNDWAWICVTVHHEPFAKPGMSDEMVNEEIKKHQTFIIDGSVIPIQPSLSLVHKWCDGQPVNKRTCGGAESSTCFDARNAEPGLHLAELNLVDSQNQPLSYQWAFQIDKDLSDRYVTPMYLPPTYKH